MPDYKSQHAAADLVEAATRKDRVKEKTVEERKPSPRAKVIEKGLVISGLRLRSIPRSQDILVECCLPDRFVKVIWSCFDERSQQWHITAICEECRPVKPDHCGSMIGYAHPGRTSR